MSVTPPPLAVLDDRVAVTKVPLFSSHPLNLLAQLSAKYCPKRRYHGDFLIIETDIPNVFQ